MKHYIDVRPKGYGHWYLEFSYNGQPYRTVTNDSQLVDKIYDANIEDDEKTINEIYEKITENL